MDQSSRKNENAARLCKYIDELTVAFRDKKFDEHRYSSEERQKAAFLSDFFGLSEFDELMVLCLLIDKRIRHNGWISLEEFSARNDLKLEDCVMLHFALDNLVRLHLVRATDEEFRSREKEYSVAQNCMNAILEYDIDRLKPKREFSFESFMLAFQEIGDNRNPFSLNPEETLTELLDEFGALKEIRWLAGQKLAIADQYVVLAGVRSYMLRNSGFNLSEVVSEFMSGKLWLVRIEKQMIAGRSPLLQKGLVEFRPGSFQDVRNMRLTQKSIENLCSSVEPMNDFVFYPRYFKVHNPADNTSEYIHDNPDLKLIEKMVSREHYDKLKEKVPRLTILLTGSPGVGKTSFVAHLARLSGRKVLSASIAEVLSAYVGESEKNLVGLFREADQAYECHEITPIIVFDEAETLLYRRNGQTGKAVDQMSNNIISLLLASLDNFRGILVCCSNFGFQTGSFDPALHRRFHLVSEIPVPPVPVLRSILQSHFPALDESGCTAFLERYPFITPAQIRNIREKYDVQAMLGETSSLAEDLDRIARRDLSLFIRQQTTRIGFGYHGTKKIHNFSTSN
ncbi:ATPase family associated with various cellular activities [Bacteroidales bacterium 6E]|nr:ATPase family associated with various cellular activities [Bacteroidales bacterium 6E]